MEYQELYERLRVNRPPNEKKEESLFQKTRQAAQLKVWDKIFQEDHKSEIIKKGILETGLTVFGEEAENRLKALEERVIQRQLGGKINPKDVIGFFITVSPPPGTQSADELIAHAKELFFKENKKFTHSYFAIEQGGQGETIGYHPHLHIIILTPRSDQNSEPARIMRWLREKFQKIMPDKAQLNVYLDIKPLTENNFRKKLAYISGYKDDGKKEKVEADIIWRNNNHYEQVYSYVHPAYREESNTLLA